MSRRLKALLFLCGLFGLWEASIRSGLWPRILLPSPFDVAAYLLRALRDGTLLQASAVTLRRLLLGYGASVALGLPLGLVNARYPFARDTLGVAALGLQTLPSVCWVPMSLLWFGQTETAMFVIVLMGSLWSIVLAVEGGVRRVPPIYARAARTMGSTGPRIWLTVILPAALPDILGGMKQGWAFSWRSLMAAEIYVTIMTGFGLGHLLHYGRELHAMDQVIGIMSVIMTIGLLTDRALFSPCERLLHKRWGTDR